jgi:hypothetical protein
MYCQNPETTQPQLYPDFIDQSINSALTDYFENDTIIPDGLIPFVFFQYYKLVHDSADHYRAMLRLYTNSICIRHQQVFDFNIGFRPVLYVIHIRKDTHNYTIEQVDSPPLFTSKTDTINVMFSEDLYKRILSKEKDCYFEINMQHTKKRIIDYCKNILPADRFTYVEPPSGVVDLHHDENVYSYLNLKSLLRICLYYRRT